MASESGDSGTACTLEFAVQMTCQSCVDAVRTSLQGVAGVQSVEVQLENQMVVVQTTLPSQEVQAILEGTGRQAVLKGMGSGILENLGAAVAILGGPGPVQGVVRFLQLTPERCLIEGTIDGLEPGPHGLHVHQFGDLTRNCNSCGDHFNPDGTSHGGPQDSERVSVHLSKAWAERGPRVSETGQVALGASESETLFGGVLSPHFIWFSLETFIDTLCDQGLPTRSSQSRERDH
uniref:Superoxide dismutase copper chaperone n=1 Tax=Equus asinus TaxID=9793 RepID=A0A9L0I9W4_EQUAS